MTQESLTPLQGREFILSQASPQPKSHYLTLQTPWGAHQEGGGGCHPHFAEAKGAAVT